MAQRAVEAREVVIEAHFGIASGAASPHFFPKPKSRIAKAKGYSCKIKIV